MFKEIMTEKFLNGNVYTFTNPKISIKPKQDNNCHNKNIIIKLMTEKDKGNIFKEIIKKYMLYIGMQKFKGFLTSPKIIGARRQ